MCFAVKVYLVRILIKQVIEKQRKKCKTSEIILCFSPEGTGVCIAIIFLLVTIIEQLLLDITKEKLVEYNAALLSICLVVLLGFIDDVVDLRWSHKLIVPTIASFPLLVAYNGITHVLVPSFIKDLIGSTTINLGFLYYVYMGSLAVFCTNTINIYAGINGIEVGQSFIIGCFICTHNVIVSLH
jgi:UDP-N-acetylglucosamine--dolichyl-phosphate N-acetylglucosaminephosphotransferase